MPDHLQKVSLAPAENVEIAGVRIALQRLLHENRKGAESFSHIRVARRQPHPNAARKSDHLSGSFARPDLRSPASAPITLARVVSSGEPSIVIRTLAPKAIVIAARGETGVGAGSGAMGATVTGNESGKTILRGRQLLSPTIQEASINAGLLRDLGRIGSRLHQRCDPRFLFRARPSAASFDRCDDLDPIHGTVAIPGVSHTVLRRIPSRARRRIPDGYGKSRRWAAFSLRRKGRGSRCVRICFWIAMPRGGAVRSARSGRSIRSAKRSSTGLQRRGANAPRSYADRTPNCSP